MFDIFRSKKDKTSKSSTEPNKFTGNEAINKNHTGTTTANTTTMANSSDRQKEEKPRMVHIKTINNATKSLLTTVPLENFTWKLAGNSWITETRTFYVINKIGEYLFIQIAYTDSGWPMQASCQVSSCYFDTRQAEEKCGIWQTCNKLEHARGKKDKQKGLDGHVIETSNHGSAKLKLSESKSGMKIADAELRLCGPNLTTIHDISSGKISDKAQHISLKCSCKGSLISIDLTMEPIGKEEEGKEGFQFGDGNISFGIDESDGFINMKFLPCLRIYGSISLDGVERDYKGFGMGLHQLQAVRPNQVATRWNTVLFIADNESKDDDKQIMLFMIQISTPNIYGGDQVNYGYYFADGKLQALCKDNLLKGFEPLLDSKSGYYIPNELSLQWKGKTIDDAPFTAECRVKPKILVNRINLLDLLPFVMRKIIETFVTRPFVYQWADRTTVNLNQSEKTETLNGWIFNEITILNDESI